MPGLMVNPLFAMQKSPRCLILLALGFACSFSYAATRSWTDSNGRKVEAEFSGMKGDSVLLKLTTGQTVPFPLARLSGEDQAFVKTLGGGGGGAPAASSPAPGASMDAKRVPLEKRIWPEAVVVPARSIEIAAITENVAERKFVYQSEAFEFTSQAKLAGSAQKRIS